MSGRGPQTFKKRQKEQLRKERQQEKFAKRLERKDQPQTPGEDSDLTGYSDYLDDVPTEANPFTEETTKSA